MTFLAGTLLWTLILTALTVLLGVGGALWPELWRSLPRNRVAGFALALICLVWSAWHGQQLLEDDLTRFRPWLWSAVPVLAVLGYFHLDFLFARALGGFVLLLMPFLLHSAFVEQVPYRPVFSAACYLFGLVGMGLVATPWYFRDLLEKCTLSATWRRTSAIVAGTCAFFFAVFAVLA